MASSQLKMPLQLLNGVPELRSLGFDHRGEEVVISQVLSFEEVHPKSLLILV
jgi:hypothetical protein